MSVVSSTGEALVRLVEKELGSDRRAEAAVRATRRDQGKATARFAAGWRAVEVKESAIENAYIYILRYVRC